MTALGLSAEEDVRWTQNKDRPYILGRWAEALLPKHGTPTTKPHEGKRHLEETSLQLLRDSLKQLDSGFAALPAITENSVPARDPRLNAVMSEVATKLPDNYPYFHPLYAGQMLKPPHPIARAAYA